MEPSSAKGPENQTNQKHIRVRGEEHLIQLGGLIVEAVQGKWGSGVIGHESMRAKQMPPSMRHECKARALKSLRQGW